MLGIKNEYMKRIEILLLLCLCIVECSAKRNVDTVLIRFFSWEDYKQPHIVSCNSFENELPYTEYYTYNKSAIGKLYEGLKDLRKTSDITFNVGCKLLFLNNGKIVKKVCLNSKYVITDGYTFFCSQKLMDTIDSIKHNSVIVDRQRRFLPDQYGNEYIYGRDSLFSKFKTNYKKNIPASIRKNGDTRIVVYCQSDKKGKTSKIERISIYNTNLLEDQKKIIEKMIYNFFMRKVKWKTDETRMQSDWIVINYKIEEEK